MPSPPALAYHQLRRHHRSKILPARSPNRPEGLGVSHAPLPHHHCRRFSSPFYVSHTIHEENLPTYEPRVSTTTRIMHLSMYSTILASQHLFSLSARSSPCACISIPPGLRFLCTYGTSMADMSAHLPPLPYICIHPEVTVEDEEGILLALQHRDRP
ncbi:hypothetical protein BC827DRAFT_1384731 [Russula dissimulans]|nr:hypothetical protein BC827DRAFT_1384731 [Russula dissimulans]